MLTLLRVFPERKIDRKRERAIAAGLAALIEELETSHPQAEITGSLSEQGPEFGIVPVEKALRNCTRLILKIISGEDERWLRSQRLSGALWGFRFSRFLVLRQLIKQFEAETFAALRAAGDRRLEWDGVLITEQIRSRLTHWATLRAALILYAIGWYRLSLSSFEASERCLHQAGN
jgi:hypothetical protein